MNHFADLHLHTKYSDGLLTPEQIFVKSQAAGFSAISIVDHDTVKGCFIANSIKHKYPLEFINGIELSCFENNKEYHILGYFIDIGNKALNNHITEYTHQRYIRAEKILKKLNRLGIIINIYELIEIADEAPLTRPHIAHLLVSKGYASNFKDAFTNFLGEGRPAYENKPVFPVSKAIKMINRAGGVAVIAHPANSIAPEVLYNFIDQGLDGIEVVHPLHDDNLKKYYHSIASQYLLLETGGSDYHGTRDFDDSNFGKFVVPYSTILSIKRRINL